MERAHPVRPQEGSTNDKVIFRMVAAMPVGEEAYDHGGEAQSPEAEVEPPELAEESGGGDEPTGGIAC